MLYRWLPKQERCNIPPYAHTSVGVGGVVINDKNEVLVVSEKYRLFEHWKLPGGYVEPGISHFISLNFISTVSSL